MAAGAAAIAVLVVGAGLLVRTTPDLGSASASPGGSASVVIAESPSAVSATGSASAVPATSSPRAVAPVGDAIVWPRDDLIDRVGAGGVPSGSVVVTDLTAADLTTYADDSFRSCPELCPRWALTDGNVRVIVLQSMLEPAPTAIAGRLAFLVVDLSLRFLGPVGTTPEGRAIGPLPLTGESPGGEAVYGAFVAVHGWLRKVQPVQCPSSATTLIGLDQQRIVFGCPRTWIQPTAALLGPMILDPRGSVLGPTGALLVQTTADRASETPEEGDFLVRKASVCPTGIFCSNVDLGPLDGATPWDLIGSVVGP